jgi:hypothetical protein
MKKVFLLLFWICCGYLNWGLEIGYLTNRFPESDHRGFAALCAITGPFCIPASLADWPLHWRTRPMTIEERWEAFHAQWPSLSREYFERRYN